VVCGEPSTTPVPPGGLGERHTKIRSVDPHEAGVVRFAVTAVIIGLTRDVALPALAAGVVAAEGSGGAKGTIVVEVQAQGGTLVPTVAVIFVTASTQG
jgi:hypothetical protein